MSRLPGIVSVDDHVIEPPDMFEGRLPAKFRDRTPRVRRLPYQPDPTYKFGVGPADSGPETDFWDFDGVYLSLARVEVGAGMEPERVTAEPITFEEMPVAAYRPKERLEIMDAAHIERSLCFPNSVQFAGQFFMALQDKDYALACVKAYNDWMVEEWAADSGGRLVPLCVVPLWDSELAAQEIRRNADRGVRAVTFTELPPKLGLPSLHDKDGYWEPFIDACDETKTVICLHIGSSSDVPITSLDAPLAVCMSTVNFNVQLSFTDWLFSGHLVRRPNLKLAFSEGQLGWMPFVLERMDRVWRNGNEVAGIDPAFVEPPSSYLNGRVYGCFYEDTFGVQNRYELGVDMITFEADYPHQDSNWPHTQKILEEALQGVPDDEAIMIARGNALRMLELDDVELVDFAQR